MASCSNNNKIDSEMSPENYLDFKQDLEILTDTDNCSESDEIEDCKKKNRSQDEKYYKQLNKFKKELEFYKEKFDTNFQDLRKKVEKGYNANKRCNFLFNSYNKFSYFEFEHHIKLNYLKKDIENLTKEILEFKTSRLERIRILQRRASNWKRSAIRKKNELRELNIKRRILDETLLSKRRKLEKLRHSKNAKM